MMAQRELNVYSPCGVLFEGVCPPYSATKAALHRPLETVLVGVGLAFVGWVRIHAMGTPCLGVASFVVASIRFNTVTHRMFRWTSEFLIAPAAPAILRERHYPKLNILRDRVLVK